MKPYYQDEFVTLYHGDALELLPLLGPQSVEAAVTDPPYFRLVDEDWDDQWATDFGAFHGWLMEAVDVMLSRLVSRGTLAVFCAPDYAARVEVGIAERAAVINHIVWMKRSGRLAKASPGGMRRFFPQSERLILAEQLTNAGNLARNTANIDHAVARQAYAPIREKLDGLRRAAGLSLTDVDRALGTNGMAGHYFQPSQWSLPTREAWGAIRALLVERLEGELVPEYDELRREYDELRREYDELRREFNGEAMPSGWPKLLLGDVWDFAPVMGSRKRLGHTTQKPIELMRHLIRIITRPGDTVLDPFAGSGTTLAAAKDLGCKAIGIEVEEKYCQIAAQRCAQDVLDLGAAA